MSSRMDDLGRLEKRLLRAAADAIADFALVEEGDRILVAVSGGKDSWTLLHVLLRLRERAPIDFDLVAVNLDQGQPGYPARVVEDHLRSLGVPYRMLVRDTYSVVRRLVPEGKTTCPVCSRLRRGVLYDAAAEMGCTKIALGHHRDDLVETLFLNLFYGGKLKAMPPKLLSDDGRHIVIRPLAYVPERLIARYAKARRFPLIPCTLCGSQPNLQREAVGRMLRAWEREHPGRVESIFAALKDIAPSQLADTALFDFAGLEARRAAGPTDEDGRSA
jgi:tRNA 2-thiocytidine biosynthesis protein TtcA